MDGFVSQALPPSVSGVDGPNDSILGTTLELTHIYSTPRKAMVLFQNLIESLEKKVTKLKQRSNRREREQEQQVDVPVQVPVHSARLSGSMCVEEMIASSLNSLDQIPSGSVGLYPFPVEIWKHIFSFTGGPIQYSVNGFQTYQYFFSEEIESLLWDPNFRPDNSLSHTRHSIILTCRSWYHMGMSNFWSHILLNGSNLDSVASKILDIIKAEPIRGSWIKRLSIFRASENELRSAVPVISEILPFLINLSTLYCSVQLLEALSSSITANTAVIHGDPTTNTRYSLRVSGSSPKNVFWRHCQILSLDCSLWNLEDVTNGAPITFANLTDLRISISEPQILTWIVAAWHLPIIKNLSMIISRHSYEISLTPLLRRIRLKLEKIQLPVTYMYSTRPEDDVELPKLMVLHLLNLLDETNYVSKDRYCIINAPNLCRLSFYVYYDRSYKFGYWYTLLFMESKLLSMYSSIKEIDLIVPRGEWIGPSVYKSNELVAKFENIHDWICNWERVRVIWGIKGKKDTFSLKHPESYREKLDRSARLVVKGMR